ncbi:MAG: acyl-CoA dehydrogenase family protein [Proteobacteria bacterium]|nr:acyl-CoA dehydrogenase family protein [Pseudomonadota bacterium]
MDFKLTPEQQALKKELEEFFAREMKDAPPDYQGNILEATFGSDGGWEFYKEIKKKYAETGYHIMAWPKEYGGRGATIIEQLIFEEVSSYYGGPHDPFGLGMFAPTVLLYGNDDQKQRILPAIASGEWQYCQGWSEPNAGSDLASLKTTAIKDGDHYVINGQKIWTTGAHRADHIFLLVRTDPSSRRSAGLSVFNVDLRLPGIEVRPIRYMNGTHLYNEIFFTDVRVPEFERIGGEGEGWKLTRATMNFERSGVGFFSEVRRGLEGLIRYVKTTRRDGRLLSENPIVRQKIAKLAIDMEVGRALAYRVGWEQEKGNLLFSAAAASEAKVMGSELAQRMSNFATEIMGLYGQLEASKWAPMNGTMVDTYQLCMGFNIAAGSSEIQRNIIAWVGVGLPRI